ncbi:N-acetylmuramoyl-L-alanine amidase [Anaeromyxobacter diazotrophicus]|nr:N-acetylmuramoyl-L-alanine amidase [Anaeromyxobacter diazotrophicus]
MVAAPAALSLLLVISAAVHGRPAPRQARAAVAARASAARPAPGSALERARVLLAQVKRDPAKRRYRHQWERAIAALERAARGRDAGPALLEAARARYALYRYSQVEADREAALRLAQRARKAGAREAGAFAAAVKEEMGEEEPAPKAKRGRGAARGQGATATASAASSTTTSTATAGPTATATAAAPAATAAGGAGGRGAAEESDEEPSTDPALREALRGAEGGEAAGPARVSEVKSWSNGDYTRIAVYLSRQVPFTKEEIPAEGALPRRLALDLKPASLAGGLAHPVGDALVQRVRAAQRGEDTVRVVLDLAGRDDLAIFQLDDPPRLIVDVGVREARRDAQAAARRADASAPAEAAPAAEAAPEARTAHAEPEQAAARPVRRVVVDAGHGGHDTGAIGPSGVREKDVTLAMARRLAARLRARGFEVVLTRDADRFVPLEERTAIANAHHGDLFVSLHANAHPRRDRRGLETYVLDVADDRYARRLAARENGALDDGAEEGQEVRRILTDLDAQSSAAASRRLAETVQREVGQGVRSRVGDVRDLGVKSALFYVLLGARMPAVLVETSFISNRVEERRLASARFQDEVAAGVTRAVERFAARGPRVAAR